MIKVIGVRFRTAGKIYFFSPGKLEIKQGDNVIVETARGVEFGYVAAGPREVEEDNITLPLKSVIRIATADDIRKEEKNREKEKEAFKICLEKIRKHGLEMKLIDAEYTFDNNKVLFYFTADGRIDFRELVKDLASVFRTRIELRQIGVRDETKIRGGIGICGRPLCCHTYLTEFAPVSIKMAKEQNLSLNPSKISGVCGRLMCCLAYEQPAYEYLNRYYVTEGNKRVSVLKYFEADSIYAHVTRILPKRTDTRESELYYELIDFWRCSRINFIEFSKPGSYIRLQELVGKRVGDPWTDEERSGFSTAYYYFRRAYEDNGGRRLTSTVGDAMLAYMEIYGYPSLRGVSGEEIRRAVARAWEEITLQQEEEPIDVKLTPEEETRKRDLLSKMLPKAAPKPLKVAFLHDKAPETSGWTYGHELGRRHLEAVFPGQVETCAYCNTLDGDPLVVMEQAIQEGYQVLFTTSPRLLPSSLRAAVDHPEALILNCSLNTSHRYIRTYYARMYEVKFISGAIAGALAGGDNIGYVGDYPIFGQVASINAFALGVQLTNPRTRVYLEWSSVSSGESAVQRLTDRGIRLISAQDLTKLGGWKDSSFGLSLVGEDGQVNLAMPVWRWGVYYEELLRRIRNKSFQSEYQESRKALNYYWGMSAGVVELCCSDKLPDSAQKLAAILRDGICSGNCHPFRGPLYAQGGRQVIGASDTLSTEDIINMDWLVDNIVGAIPTYEELSEAAKATVGIVGVPSTKEKQTDT